LPTSIRDFAFAIYAIYAVCVQLTYPKLVNTFSTWRLHVACQAV